MFDSRLIREVSKRSLMRRQALWSLSVGSLKHCSIMGWMGLSAKCEEVCGGSGSPLTRESELLVMELCGVGAVGKA